MPNINEDEWFPLRESKIHTKRHRVVYRFECICHAHTATLAKHSVKQCDETRIIHVLVCFTHLPSASSNVNDILVDNNFTPPSPGFPPKRPPYYKN